MLHRLSSAVAAVRVWLSAKHEADKRHRQTLAECRALRRELRDLQDILRRSTEHHNEVVEDSDGRIESLKAELQDARDEIRNMQWQQRENESAIALKDSEIESLSLMNARLRTKVEALIALDQFNMARRNRPGPEEVI